MIIAPLSSTEYGVVAPHDAASTVEDVLERDTCLVVKDKGAFVGVLTLADVGRNRHKLVVDCLTPKPRLDCECDIEQALVCFEKHSLHVLPVFKSMEFFAIIRYRDVLRFLHTEHRRLAPHARKIEQYDSLKMLASGVGHDFNNILTGAVGQLNLALQYDGIHPEAAELLRSVEKRLFSSRNLSQQLLTFSTDSAPAKELCNIAELIRDTVPFFLKGTSVQARFDFPPGLPCIALDKGQISQVVSNLTVNAVQAMPLGGLLSVSAWECESGALMHRSRTSVKHVIIRFEDTGIGVEEEDLPRIFDPYVTSKAEGHGLGLSIVYSTVTKHGGRIEAASQVGRGTVFDIYLPCPPVCCQAENDFEKSPKTRRETADSAGKF